MSVVDVVVLGQGALGDLVEQCGKIHLGHCVVVGHIVHVKQEVDLVIHGASVINSKERLVS